MKLSVRQGQPRGGGQPLVAFPLMHGLKKKKSKIEKKIQFFEHKIFRRFRKFGID